MPLGSPHLGGEGDAADGRQQLHRPPPAVTAQHVSSSSVMTSACLFPIVDHSVAAGLTILQLGTTGVVTLLLICAIATPAWVTSGWGDDDVQSTILPTWPPVQWSPFSFCNASNCVTLPDSSFGRNIDGTGSTYLSSCSNPLRAGMLPPTQDDMSVSMRASQGFAILAFILAAFATVAHLFHSLVFFFLWRRLGSLLSSAAACQHEMTHTEMNRSSGGAEATTIVWPPSSSQQDGTVGLTILRSNHRHHQPDNGGEVDADGREVISQRDRSGIWPAAAASWLLASRSNPQRQPVAARVLGQHLAHHHTVIERQAIRTLTSHADHASRKGGEVVTDEVILEAYEVAKSAIARLVAARERLMLEPIRQLEQLRWVWFSCVTVLFLATLCAAIAIIIFDRLYQSTVNCGDSFCHVLLPLTGGPCGHGASYRAFLAATILCGLGFLIEAVVVVMLWRPVQLATSFEHNLLSAFTEECREVESLLLSQVQSLATMRQKALMRLQASGGSGGDMSTSVQRNIGATTSSPSGRLRGGDEVRLPPTDDRASVIGHDSHSYWDAAAPSTTATHDHHPNADGPSTTSLFSSSPSAFPPSKQRQQKGGSSAYTAAHYHDDPYADQPQRTMPPPTSTNSPLSGSNSRRFQHTTAAAASASASLERYAVRDASPDVVAAPSPVAVFTLMPPRSESSTSTATTTRPNGGVSLSPSPDARNGATAATSSSSPYRGKAVVGPPPNEPGWVYEQHQELYFSESRKMFYDPQSKQYYDPRKMQWWNGVNWYTLAAPSPPSHQGR